MIAVRLCVRVRGANATWLILLPPGPSLAREVTRNGVSQYSLHEYAMWPEQIRPRNICILNMLP